MTSPNALGKQSRQPLSQAEVAARLGTTQSAVARWERGAVTPSLDAASRYATAIGVELVIGDLAVRGDVTPPSDDEGFLEPEEKASLERNLRLTPEQRLTWLTNFARFSLAGRRAMAVARTRD